MNNRQQQLNASPVATDLIFYYKHDFKAGQLRFNLISASHERQPFGCDWQVVNLGNSD